MCEWSVYAFNNDFLDYINQLPGTINDFSTDIIPSLAGKIHSYHTDSVYLDIGNYDAYAKANNIAKIFKKLIWINFELNNGKYKK